MVTGSLGTKGQWGYYWAKKGRLTHWHAHKVEAAKVAVIKQYAVTIEMQAHRHTTKQRSVRGAEESADDQFAIRVMSHFAAEPLVVDQQTEFVRLISIFDGLALIGPPFEGRSYDIDEMCLKSEQYLKPVGRVIPETGVWFFTLC